MEFTEFAQRLKPIIGGDANTALFTRTLFEGILTDEGELLIEETSENTFKAYFNGRTNITKIAQRISDYIESVLFERYLDTFSDSTIQKLCTAFQYDIKEINLHNASNKVADLFESILRSAATQTKKSAPTSANENNIINLIHEEPSTEYPYSSEDRVLLQEFNSDFDEIMLTLISENFGNVLLNGTFLHKASNLYKSKWHKKANDFLNPTLKSHVFGLLGLLNNLNVKWTANDISPNCINEFNIKLQKLYAQLHPDRYDISYPLDAFIDDWADFDH
ncbi:hypothetical protein [Streptococcus suis]